MTLTSVLTCSAITILLVSANSAAVLGSSQPLNRIERAALSENPTEELNTLITEQLSGTNVQSLLKGIAPSEIGDLRSRFANVDLLQEFLRSIVEDPDLKASLQQAAASGDTQLVIDALNSNLGGPILAISNSSITVNVDAIESILITYSKKYIQQTYNNDFLLQIILTGAVTQEIKSASSQLESYLADKVIPVACINAIVNLTRESHRSKRDLNSLLLDILVRPQLAAFLAPIQAQVDGIFNNVTAVILSFYTASQPTSPVLDVITSLTNALVIRVAGIVVDLQTTVDAFFSNIINGTTASTSRRRRDVDLEFEDFFGFDRTDLTDSHRRVRRDLVQGIGGLIGGLVQAICGLISGIVQAIGSIIGGLLQGIIGIIQGLTGVVTSNLNSLVKNLFVSILSSQYDAIGELVTTPVRAIVEWLINSILPCSTCASIV